MLNSIAGAKTRTGGPKPELYPEPVDLARFIAAAAGARVPFKATAGLHHPYRHHQAAIGGMEFGFFNVLLAGAFADKVNMGEPDLRDLLVEESPDAFVFHDEELRFRDRRLSTEAVADALGLDYWKSQRLIIMPQALKISIPGIVSTFIGLFKDTTLVMIIGLLDPLGVSNAIRGKAEWQGIIWELYGFIALLFFIFTFSMSRYSMYLERRLRTDHG